MSDSGLLTVYSLDNIAQPGMMPSEKLVPICTAFYEELTLGVTRAYSAMSANQRIDKLVKCFNTTLPYNAEYVILEDGCQYRISLKQVINDEVDLTLERLGEYLDVAE